MLSVFFVLFLLQGIAGERTRKIVEDAKGVKWWHLEENGTIIQQGLYPDCGEPPGATFLGLTWATGGDYLWILNKNVSWLTAHEQCRFVLGDFFWKAGDDPNTKCHKQFTQNMRVSIVGMVAGDGNPNWYTRLLRDMDVKMDTWFYAKNREEGKCKGLQWEDDDDCCIVLEYKEEEELKYVPNYNNPVPCNQERPAVCHGFIR